MSYLDKYIAMADIDNKKTEYDWLLEDEIESFKEYMSIVPKQITKYKEANKIDCTIQDASFNDKKNGDEKIVCTLPWEILNVGEVIVWENIEWLIMFEENNTLKSHRTFIIRPCNDFLRFKIGDTKYSIPTIVTNQTLYTVGIEEGKVINLGDTKLSITVGISEDTKYIFRGMRFLFDSNKKAIAYEITYIDTLSRKGLLTATLKETELKTDVDNIEDLIAFNGEITPQPPQPVGNLILNGNQELYLSKTNEYSITYEDNSPVTDKTFIWSLDDNTLATIQSYTNTSCTLLGVKIGWIILTGICVEDNSITFNKDIWVRGQF